MKNRLRILRTDRNWSQAELAERLGVSRQTINALETGKYDPSLPLAIKIAQLFRCPIETIFFFDPINPISEGGSMFERFTAKATQVIILAQQEGRLMGHNFVGTEQILLGLIAEDTGIAAKVLKSAGIKLDDARREVEKIIGHGDGTGGLEIPFTPRAKFVLDYALQESRRLRHHYIGTEHLLLGSLRVTDGVAVQVLQILGVDIENLREQVLKEIMPSGIDPLLMASSSPSRTDRNDDFLSESPADFTSGAISARFCGLLFSWVEPRKLGYVLSSSAGFQLPNGDVLAPHICFFSRDRLKGVPRTYPEFLPDLVVEIKSAFDRLISVQGKIMRFLELGVGVALLINPDDRTVAVYNRNTKQIVTMLTDRDKLTIPELLPGWEVPVSELWPSAFNS